ncbi:hypothetical protein Taro_044049 [Colocasia esculenta]|uniref:Uncharacterized protein n=1 Tax=Colocasia esculenta TaxID=4460 RepID=A0A843X4X7_COLES|nr:hypothetical protein [Colocasia esculenta]
MCEGPRWPCKPPYLKFERLSQGLLSFSLSSGSQYGNMGEGMEPVFHGAVLEAFLEADEDSVSFSWDSRDSIGSSSSDLMDDATSSTAAGSPAAASPSRHPQMDACGPLYELSSLMDQLPIKRGLSKFFSGKSQSFTSLSSVRCVEDLPKKETPYMRRMKPCRSYGGGVLDLSSRPCFAPGPCNKTISKKSSRGSCASLAARRGSRGIFCSSKPPPLPVQKDM